MPGEKFKIPLDRIDNKVSGIGTEVRRTEREIEIIEKRRVYARTALEIENYLTQVAAEIANAPISADTSTISPIPTEVGSVMAVIKEKIESYMNHDDAPWPEEMKEKFYQYSTNYIHSVVRARRQEIFLHRGGDAFPEPPSNEQREEVDGRSIFFS